MSRQMNFADMFNVISSPGSEDGPSPCGEQAGQQTDPSGPGAAPASRSHRLADAGAWTTSATSGPSGSASLRSAGLSSALASRLAATVECDGSTLYAMTWRDTATPAGRYHPRLAVTALRTQESGCTGWPTPTAKDGDSSGRADRAPGSHPGTTLTDAARMAGWYTPQAQDAEMTGELSRGRRCYKMLVDQVRLTGGPTQSGSSAATAHADRLNPAFVLWLMGFSAEWLCSGVRAMRLSYRRRKRSSAPTRISPKTS